MKEQEKIKHRAPLREKGCLAANDPMFEHWTSFLSRVIDDAGLFVVWSGNKVFVVWSGNQVSDNRREVRNTPIADYNVHIDRFVNCMQQWGHCLVIGPGSTKSWDLQPRFDEVTQRYIDYLEERTVPRINPTRLYEKLRKRDLMHFNSSQDNIAALSLVISDAVRWTGMVSVTRAKVDKLIHILRSSGVPPERQVLEATEASSDEDDRTQARQVRFNLPPVEAVEKAIVASASSMEDNTRLAEDRSQLAQRDVSPNYESDDELRPGS